jgi:hypothetical protein
MRVSKNQVTLLSCAVAALFAAGSTGAVERFAEAQQPPRVNPIPAEGILIAEFKEAKTTELYAVIEMIRAALRVAVYPGNPDRWVNVEAVYPDVAIIRAGDGKFMAYPYSLGDNNAVTIGTPTEVIEQYMPVAMREAQASFIEAKAEGDAQPSKFVIRVIQSGMSGNRAYYSDDALKEALPLFEGCRVFVKSDAEHLRDGGGKDVRNIIGRLTECKFVPGKAKDTGEVQATLELLDANDGIATKLREAIKKDMTDLFGFSVDLLGQTQKRMVEGKPVRVLTRATKVNSVDLIVEPGAGGALVRMVEAVNPSLSMEIDPMRNKLIDKIKAKLPAARIAALGDLTTVSEEVIESAYREALQVEATEAEAAAAATGATAPASTGGVTQADLDAAMRMVEAKNYAPTAINASGLPQAAKERLVEAFAKQANFTKADVDGAIKAEGAYIARFTESGRVAGLGGIEVEDTRLKTNEMLDAFFDPSHKHHRAVQSFKECYIHITGDTKVTGRLEHCDRSRLAESLGTFREALDSTSFGNVLGSSITRRMIADYRLASEYDAWRQVAATVPVSDFRTQERTRFGGYADLAIVPENDAYPDLSSPTDEKATYAVNKRGGLERVSLEMIKNDDVGSIRRLPIKISRAAKRTLSKFVLDFLRNPPVIYDGVAFFHATHANLFTAALDATSLAASRLAMMKQTELNSADRIAVPPRKLVVPLDLQEAAVNLFKLSTNNEKTFIQSLTMDIVPVWYWTDATDWCTVADPMDIPTIEIGFLDGNEEPELFVQDMPNVGSLFSNDQITWKVRHTYGGNVTDFRGATKNVVAG